MTRKPGRSQTAATALRVSVAALVRARTVEFRQRSRVSPTHTGAQWTARPTNALRLWAEIGARPSWPQLTPLTRTGLRSFWGVRKWRTRENGEAAVLSTVLFLRAWTPARLWADWRAAILAAVPSRWVKRGRGLFRPGWPRAVAALVRARTTGFKPKYRVRTSNSGAQWTARPTLLSTPLV